MSAHLTPEQLESAAAGEPFEHLAGCLSCQRTVADARGRARLLRGLTPYTLSDMAFRRVEARLMEQVEQGLPAAAPLWQRLWWLAPMGALAAAAVWLWAGADGASGTRPLAVGPLARAPVALAVAHVEPLTVLRASSDARLRHDTGPWVPLGPGDVVSPGDAVFGTSVQLASAGELAWSFELSGAAAMGAGASLSLGAGELKARISGAAADVGVGGLHVVASDAVFSLNRSAAEVVVDVSEGSVEVIDASSAVRRTLAAPLRVRWADGASLSAAPELPAQPVSIAAAPARPWVRFDAASLPAGAVLSLDGLLLEHQVQLVSAGRHRLSIAGPGEVAHESWIELSGPYQPTLPALEVTPEPDARAVARIQAALQRQRPRLSACYEKWLKANPAAVAADVELHLVVAASGHVTQATVQGAVMSPSSAECLVSTVKALTLPGLGSEVELALPLHLTTTR